MKRMLGAAFAASLLLGAATAQTPDGPSRPKPDPQILQRLLADAYPSDMLAQKREGDVGVQMCVDASGAVSDARLVSSSGWESLDNATLRVVRASHWFPARDATGRPVDTCRPPYQFTIAWLLPNR